MSLPKYLLIFLVTVVNTNGEFQLNCTMSKVRICGATISKDPCSLPSLQNDYVNPIKIKTHDLSADFSLEWTTESAENFTVRLSKFDETLAGHVTQFCIAVRVSQTMELKPKLSELWVSIVLYCVQVNYSVFVPQSVLEPMINVTWKIDVSPAGADTLSHTGYFTNTDSRGLLGSPTSEYRDRLVKVLSHVTCRTIEVAVLGEKWLERRARPTMYRADPAQYRAGTFYDVGKKYRFQQSSDGIYRRTIEYKTENGFFKFGPYADTRRRGNGIEVIGNISYFLLEVRPDHICSQPFKSYCWSPDSYSCDCRVTNVVGLVLFQSCRSQNIKVEPPSTTPVAVSESNLPDIPKPDKPNPLPKIETPVNPFIDINTFLLVILLLVIVVVMGLATCFLYKKLRRRSRSSSQEQITDDQKSITRSISNESLDSRHRFQLPWWRSKRKFTPEEVKEWNEKNNFRAILNQSIERSDEDIAQV